MNLIGEKVRKDVNNEVRLLLLIANELFRKDRVKPLVSIRSGSKSILKFSINPDEIATNEQKVACLRIIGRNITNNVYDKAIEEALLKEFQKRKAKKKAEKVLMQHPIEEKPNFIQTVENAVEEPKIIKKTINQPNWQNSYSF